jgi:hypothetical protein
MENTLVKFTKKIFEESEQFVPTNCIVANMYKKLGYHNVCVINTDSSNATAVLDGVKYQLPRQLINLANLFDHNCDLSPYLNKYFEMFEDE